MVVCWSFVFMIEAIKQESWKVPTSLNNEKFELMKLFSFGGVDSETNIRERDANFGDLFLKVACQKCNLPQSLDPHNLEEDEVLNFRDMIEPEIEIAHYRTPIKLVGMMLRWQKTGTEGPLLTNGSPNYFICRSRFRNESNKWEECLRIVKLSYRSGWYVNVAQFIGPNQLFEGPCRVFTAVP
jgi:hypothetical protein